MCTVKAKKTDQKHTTKNFVGFHNNSPLLTTLQVVDMQKKVEILILNRKKTGLKINHGKTMVMKWNVNLGMKIQLEGSDIKEEKKFVYFGATVTSTVVQVKI